MKDPVKVSGDAFKVMLKNRWVRVLDYKLKKGKKDKMHSHPSLVYCVIKGGKIKRHFPSGRAGIASFKDGEVGFQDPIKLHSMENVGKTDIHFILIELK
jgi:oxalate decarboxylase/phosphoglucose isomerase-like protein (cupin superfamily)